MAEDARAVGKGAVAALILAGVFLFVANLLYWVDSTIFDSGEFTDAVEDTLGKPQVQQRLGEVIATEVVDSAQLQRRVEEQVPSDFSLAVPIVINQAEPVLADIAARIIASELTGQITAEVIPRLHRELLAILEDDSRVQVQGDSLVLHLGGTLDAVFERLGIEPPEGSARGDFVLIEDAGYLRQASFFVQNRQEITLAMFLGALVLFGVAAWMIRDVRQSLHRISTVLIAVGIVTLLVVLISNWVLANTFEENTALRELIKSFEVNYERQSVLLVLLGAIGIAATDVRVRRFLTGAYHRVTRAGASSLERYGASRVLLAAAAAVVVLVLIF